jgi:hypothetical protein
VCGELKQIASSNVVPELKDVCAGCMAHVYDDAFRTANAAWMRRCLHCEAVLPIGHGSIYCNKNCANARNYRERTK